MSTYICGFLISIFLIYCAEGKRFIGRQARVLTILSIFIPCIIAGLRADTIGTDIKIYVVGLFTSAKQASSIFEYFNSGYSAYGWDYSYVADMEIGFSLLVYFVQKIFNSMPFLLFLIQALTVIPIYKGLRAFGDRQPVWLGMAVYYLMFFNQTLNMMRQWIGMAFLFYGFQYLEGKEYRKYFTILLFASLFHITAIFGVVIFVIYQLIAKENSINRTLKAVALILIGVCSIAGLDFFVSVINLLGLRFGNYIDGNLQLMPNQLLYRLLIVLLLWWRWPYLKRDNVYARFYLIMIAYDLLASQLVSIFAQSGRIGLYFGEYYILAYPALCMSSDSKHNRRVMRIAVLLFLCFYWWYVYVHGGSGETVPYVSIFA